MAEAHDDAVLVTSRPQDLAALITATRASYQSNLLEGAQARKQLDVDVQAVRANAEEDSRAFEPDDATISRFSAAWSQYGAPQVVPGTTAAPPQTLEEAKLVWQATVQRCNAQLERLRSEREVWINAKKRLFTRTPGEPRLPPDFGTDLDLLRRIRDVFPDVRNRLLQQIETTAVPRLRERFAEQAAERDQQLREEVLSNVAAVAMAADLLGPSGLSWEKRLDAPPALPTVPRAATRIGTMSSGLPAPYSVDAPCVLEFPGQRGLALAAPMQERDGAVAALRSIVLRALLDVPPGQLRLSLIDPTAMGQTFADFLHLGDYDERLIDGGVKTSSQSIDRCLTEHVAHLETVVSKYLRGQFQSIHDYNRSAGEVAEPYRLLVVADYPRQFSDRAAEQLLSLVENGPRCGIYTLLLYAPEEEAPRGVPFARLTQSMDILDVRGHVGRLSIEGSGLPIDVNLDRCPAIAFDADGRATSQAARFIQAIGDAAKRGTDTVVSLENFLPVVNRKGAGALPEFIPGAPPLTPNPDSWWTATTADMAVAPIGRSGAQGVASLFFSSTAVAGGAIMVGLPRSGKTTSLHAMILTMCMLYSPEELELYLVDAKHGVEFKAYERLPHARMVSVHSEREFSLAVLKSIQSKIRERAELIKTHSGGLSNITEYRQATGESLPRIVVVIDEFHELFEEADAVGYEAFAAFSDVVRMGPFSGVHIVVASQTLSSMPAMDRQTLTLLPQRVAFMCNEYDAEIVMGETNKAARMLSKTGEGLFNPSRGDESRNQPFQGLYVAPQERAGVLESLRRKADAAGWIRQPRVFDGDAVVERPPSTQILHPSRRFTVPVGEPFTLAESEAIVLPRTRGSNLLLLGDRDGDETTDLSIRGVLHSMLLAAQAQEAATTTVDFIGDEEVPDAVTLMEVTDATGGRYVRASALKSVLEELAGLVAARVAEGKYRETTQILILFGLQRARSLAPYDPYDDEDTDEPSLAQLLAAIMMNGPEVGVHVVVDVDSSRAVEARLGTELLGELMIRAAGSAADPKDVSLVANSYGESTQLRFGQLLIGDQLKGTSKRARGYAILSDANIREEESANGE